MRKSSFKSVVVDVAAGAGIVVGSAAVMIGTPFAMIAIGHGLRFIFFGY